MVENVDAQVHAWEPDSPSRPWDPEYGRPAHTLSPLSYEKLRRDMRDAGVSAALLTTPSLYGYDNSYALEAATVRPAEFAVVARVNPAAADLSDRVAALRKDGRVVGIRVTVVNARHREGWRRGVFEPLFPIAEKDHLPAFLYMPGLLPEVRRIATDYPDLQLLVDHMGLAAPPVIPAGPDPFEGLPDLLALARTPNVVVKATALPALSRESYPFRDVWPVLLRVVAAFGRERVVWGSDITRVRGLHSYAEAVGYLAEMNAFSGTDLEMIMGRTLRRVLNWPQRAQHSSAQ